ncbi:hypothetical protein [Paenibacillus sp. FSL P4-0184]|uniref:hypothetical protein n=1 Tax=Paenibacillus sp. FSL P4-0184 TaxID=2921632 RepID=UPI0030FC117E
MDRKIIRCRDIGAYAHALTRGKEYVVENTDENKFRVVGDHGRKVWISNDYFCSTKENILLLQKWNFDQDIESELFVEVTLTFNDGSERWCTLTTPGNLVQYFSNNCMEPPGLYMKHLIIMKAMNKEDVEATFRYLDSHNELVGLTIPLNEILFKNDV